MPQRGGVGGLEETEQPPHPVSDAVAACTLKLLSSSPTIAGLQGTQLCVSFGKINSALAPMGLFPENTVGLIGASVLLPVGASCFQIIRTWAG